MAKHRHQHQHQPEEMRKRVNHLMSKLSDRDTESMAFADLDSICRNITPDFVPTFVSIVGDTRIADKTPLRRHSLRLISLLAHSIPPSTLTPHLPRILSASLRRLRDPESVVRSALIDSVRSLAAAAPAEALVSSLLRPLVDTLFHEQEIHSQSASAFSLAAVLDEPNSSNAADIQGYLRCLVPRLVKLVRSPVFRAKPALLTLLGSVAGAGGAKDGGSLNALVLCLAEFLGSDEWPARKAAADSLIRLAAAESDSLRGFRVSCVASFEARRYDKVKIVRDSMNRMLEIWRKIPDEDQDTPPPPQSPSQPSSSQEESTSVLKCPATSINGSSTVHSSSPFIATKTILAARRKLPATSSTTTAKTIGGRSHDLKSNSALSRNKIQGKNSNWEADSSRVVCEDNLAEGNGEEERVEENSRSRLEVRRVLFEKNCEDKMMNGMKSRSRMALIHENVNSEVNGEVRGGGGGGDEVFGMRKDCDLSLIQMKLVQIENQQSTLLDLVQKLVASSQNGRNSLEMRMHSLKIALDKISCDLDVSSRRLSNNDSAIKTCHRSPGTGFLCPKLWKRTEGRYASRFLSSAHDSGDRDCHEAFFKSSSSFSTIWSKQKFSPCGRFEDSCAELHPSSRGSEHFTSTMQRSATFDAGIKHLQDGYIKNHAPVNYEALRF
ncbi:Microtubule-associated protein TORTIFOLIA1 [Platanthera zijinensis]|uniref:Microtubule-associated protein TORTIFOLIA1 n=1 Tax=Platanthera zijinensis TaxID=2320716 RepID=A0AAP0GDQ4_9ASPA